MTDLNENDSFEEPTGKSKGGKALAASRTAEERKAASAKATAARLAKAKLPKEIASGILNLNGIEIKCAVLNDGTRVFTRTGVEQALGRKLGGRDLKRSKPAEDSEGVEPGILPIFLSPKVLQPFISNELDDMGRNPVFYVAAGGRVAQGLPATALPQVCNVWLSARDAGVLSVAQLAAAQRADILVRGLAEVGAVALVDEATGYQKDRERDALAKILEQFIAKEMRAWVKTYPAEFFEELCRLRGVPFKANMRAPQYFGHLINNITYDRMAPDLREALKAEKAKAKKSGSKMHQFLSDDTGYGMLQKRLTGITTLMQASTSYDEFKELLDRVHPIIKAPPIDA